MDLEGRKGTERSVRAGMRGLTPNDEQNETEALEEVMVALLQSVIKIDLLLCVCYLVRYMSKNLGIG